MNRPRLSLLGLTVVVMSMTGCSFEMRMGDDPSKTYSPETDTSKYTDTNTHPEPFGGDNADLYVTDYEFADGRKVHLWYSKAGTELMEKHYSPDADAWSAPQAIYASEEADPCQGIDLVEEDGIVAAIADFGTFCYDGEPPMESLAFVGTGDLTEWQVNMTPGFDGWEEVTFADGEAEWSRGDNFLSWADGQFSEGAGDLWE